MSRAPSHPEPAGALSPVAQEMIDTVMERVASRDPNLPVSSSDLLLGLVEAASSGASTDPAAPVLLELWNGGDPKGADAEASRRSSEMREKLGELPDAGSETQFTAELAGILLDAGDRARRYGGASSPVDLRHLAVALLDAACDPDPVGAAGLLAAASLPPVVARRQLVERMVVSGPPEERESWAELLPRPENVFARYDADATTGDDALSVTPYVNAMGNLIASNKLAPPLSIALFGDWGSGKTFFMDRLHESVRSFAERADGDVSGDGARKHYWPRIVQIRFNAWHYVDSNLWASLVSHIFEELQRAERPEENQFEAARKGALEKLRLSTLSLAAAGERKGRATATLKEAQSLQEETRKQIGAEEGRLIRIQRRDVWSWVSFGLRKDGEFRRLQISALQRIADLGLPAGSPQNLRDLSRHLDSITRGAGRGSAFVRTLLQLPTLWVPSLVVLLAVGVAAAVPAVNVAFTAIIGTVGSALAWAARGFERFGKILEPVERFQAAVEERRAEGEALLARAEERALRRLARLQTDLDAASREVVRAREGVEVAKLEFEEAQPGAMIRHFIARRAGSADYRKHLGVVSLVRQDFEWLSRAIRYRNGLAENRSEEDLERELEGLPADLADFVRNTEDLGINRIVLYVDDLDRCPADKVVDVLQAIHLLLAFDLFVVVVGVDSRWLMASLAGQYPDLLSPQQKTDAAATSGSGNGRGDPRTGVLKGSVATPVDYLEKVFQIPFWLRPIDDAGCRNLLRQTLAGDTLLDDPGRRGEAGRGVEDGRGEAASEFDWSRLEAITPEMAEAVAARAPEPPDPLKLHRREFTAMEELAWLLGRSPRSVKRFANTYRLLKATGTVPALARVGDGTASSEDFRGAMLLLAMATGLPELAAAGIRALCKEALSGTVETWLDGLGEPRDREAAERLRKFRESDGYLHWKTIPVTSVQQSVGSVELLSFVVP